MSTRRESSKGSYSGQERTNQSGRDSSHPKILPRPPQNTTSSAQLPPTFYPDTNATVTAYGTPAFGRIPYPPPPIYSRPYHPPQQGQYGPTIPGGPPSYYKPQVPIGYGRPMTYNRGPIFNEEHLEKDGEVLIRISCTHMGKKLYAVVQSSEESEEAKKELEGQIHHWKSDGPPPISECSLPVLTKRLIKPLRTTVPMFPWAAYYCTLCDYHLKDIDHFVEHLPSHMKEEKRMIDRQSLPDKMPPMNEEHWKALEKQMEKNISPQSSSRNLDWESLLRTKELSIVNSVGYASDSDDALVKSLGSIVSGCIHSSSDINMNLSIPNERISFFVNTFLENLKQTPGWTNVVLSEIGVEARIEGIFEGIPVTIDWGNEESVKVSNLLKVYNNVQPRLEELRRVVHEWARKCQLVSKDRLAAQHAVPMYLIDIMIIHAMQQNGRLPCVHEIRKENGCDILNLDANDIIMKCTDAQKNWDRISERLMEFFDYYIKGDLKQNLIQITSIAQQTKADTKLSKKHVVVIDPFRERPIAQMHRTFQYYFLNCFLTSYVYLRVPRSLTVGSLINVRLYQLANQSPMKKKTKTPTKDEGNKEDEEMVLDEVVAEHEDTNDVECQQPLDQSELVINGKKLRDVTSEDMELDGEEVYSRKRMIKIKEDLRGNISHMMWRELDAAGIASSLLPPSHDDEPVVVKDHIESGELTISDHEMDGEGIYSRKEMMDMQKYELTSEKALYIRSLGIATFTVQVSGGEDEDEERADVSTASTTSNRKKRNRRKKKKKDENGLEVATENDAVLAAILQEEEDTITAAVLCEDDDSILVQKTYPPPCAMDENEMEKGIDELTIEDCTQMGIHSSVTEEEKNESEDAFGCEEGPSTIMDVQGEKGKNEDEMDDEIVLPDQMQVYRGNDMEKLQSTYEELYVKVEDFNKDEILSQLCEMTVDDFDISFELMGALTGGYRCDMHCTACDSTKHLMDTCPQLNIPIPPPISRTDWPQCYLDELSTAIRKCFAINHISDSRKAQIDQCLNDLHHIMSMTFEKGAVDLDLFGSSLNGFGSQNSDVDICFRFKKEYAKELSVDIRSALFECDLMKKVSAALIRSQRYTNVQPITSAKVPIVKFKNRGCNVEGDISYYNELALHNTKLLKTYCEWTTDNKLAQLGLFVKQWAKASDIGDASKGSLSSYAYILLLVHFLQKTSPPVLPVLQEMGERSPIIVDKWDVYFYKGIVEPQWSENKKSVGELFIDFLDFYSTFEWTTKVVQMRQATPLRKVEKGWRRPMCIEDPFDLDHNLGSGVSNRMYAFIVKSFIRSRSLFMKMDERKAFCKKKSILFDVCIPDQELDDYVSTIFKICRIGGGAPRDRQCFRCGKVGHYSDVCPNQQRGMGGDNRGKGEVFRRRDKGERRPNNKYYPTYSDYYSRHKVNDDEKVKESTNEGKEDRRGGRGGRTPRGNTR